MPRRCLSTDAALRAAVTPLLATIYEAHSHTVTAAALEALQAVLTAGGQGACLAALRAHAPDALLPCLTQEPTLDLPATLELPATLDFPAALKLPATLDLPAHAGVEVDRVGTEVERDLEDEGLGNEGTTVSGGEVSRAQVVRACRLRVLRCFALMLEGVPEAAAVLRRSRYFLPVLEALKRGMVLLHALECTRMLGRAVPCAYTQLILLHA